jgi:hypothetical protein
VYQYQNGVSVCGITADLDKSYGNEGFWSLIQSPPITPLISEEEQAMTILEANNVVARVTAIEQSLQTEWAYNDSNLPGYARPFIQALQDEKILVGDQDGKFSISKYLLTLYVLIGKVVVWVKNR